MRNYQIWGSVSSQRQSVEPLEQLLPETAILALTGFVVGNSQGCSTTESNNQVGRKGAWPESTFVSTAKRKRFQRNGPLVSALYNECANALRPIDLVTGARDKVDPSRRDFCEFFAKSLSSIDVEVCRVICKYYCEFTEGLDHTRLIVHLHQGYESGIGPE